MWRRPSCSGSRRPRRQRIKNSVHSTIYTGLHPNAYRKAIAQACDAAFPHPELAGIPPRQLTVDQKATLESWRKAHRWHPNQLRHSTATAIRRQYGAEAAQAVLGHAELFTTEIYAEKSLEAARQIMQAIG